MVDVDKLSDAELRTKLLEFGFPVMPITGTTRKVMAKKLKMLLENKNKVGSEGGRRSMGQYSSEEESDSDLRTTRKRDNRRVTMAAPIMQPPATNIKLRKSTRLLDPEPEPEIINPKKELLRTTTTTTTRTEKIVKSAQDEFDTGSDSESDIVANNYSPSRAFASSFARNSPIKSSLSSSYSSDGGDKYSSPNAVESTLSGRNLSFNAASARAYDSPSLASEYATDRLNQIRSRLSLNNSGYEKPVAYSPLPAEKEETPFLSNFTKRLSSLSPNQRTEFDFKNDIIKEHDTNGSSGYIRNQLSNFRAARGREPTYGYKANQSNILKNNFVSFAVLAGAALFFVFLAIMYLGMRSDTSVVPKGTIIPYCNDDVMAKKGVNCVFDTDITTSVHLLNVLKPELQKRAVANKCFDPTIKAHMTESDIINFVKTNFAVKEDKQIKSDLLNLEILTFNNPEWGLSIVQTEDNNGQVSEDDKAENMEKVIFNHASKVTSIVMFNPELPWRCTFYKTFALAFNGLLFVALFFALLYALNVGFKYYKHFEQKQKEEVGLMMEKIIDILQSSVGEENAESFVVINHVRDMILPVADRGKNEKCWERAVKLINENESRVRTEVQVVQGEPFEVWRWIGSANLSGSGDRSDYVYRQGRRLVDAEYLITEVLKFPHKRLRFCRSSDIVIKNEVRDGFLSVLLLQCGKCRKEHPVCSEDPNTELMDVNLAFVAGIVSLGLSLYQLNELCSSLQIPAISGSNYTKYLDEIYEIYDRSMADSESTKSDFSSSKKLDDDLALTKMVLRSSTPKRSSPKSQCESEKRQFLKGLEKNPSEIEHLANLTSRQKDDPLWHEERRKRLTASNFGRIFKLLDTTDRTKVAYDLLHSSFKGNVCTKYGNDNEANAVKDFEKILGQAVRPCGLFVHQSYPFLAASPDGLVGEDAIVEIKCPYKARECSPQEAIRQKLVQFATLENGKFALKRSDKYYFQVQGQLFVTGRNVCYFVVWTKFGILYEKISRDEECWDKMFPKLEEFYFRHSLPLILEEQEPLCVGGNFL